MKYGFIDVTTAVFPVKLGNVMENAHCIITTIKNLEADEKEPNVLVFPELCLTGYSCQDRFLGNEMYRKVCNALVYIAESTSLMDTIVIVGAPIRNCGKLYNCAFVIHRGEILCAIPKTYLPNYNEFYEKRWFASALDCDEDTVTISADDEYSFNIPFGTDIIIDAMNPNFRLGCEICEDLWVANPPSSMLAQHGVHVVVNPSASNDIVAKNEYRRNLVKMQSAKCNCAYVYASAGYGESTTDVVYGGHQIIASCGSILAENEYWMNDTIKVTHAMVDIEKIENDQIKMNSMHVRTGKKFRTIEADQDNLNMDKLPEYINPYPFIPSNKGKRAERCKEIMNIQAVGLATRLKKTGIRKCVIGISGGLDSTLALLVIVEAYKMLGYSFKDIIGITMPGFGTTKRTKDSSDKLMEYLGITAKTVDIKAACTQHMSDIEHDMKNYDVTYENVQARERTQILMDVANQEGGLVVGTGDMSELALGWCTYNGDHMSMYAVNVSVPKTLVKFIIETYAENTEDENIHNVLMDVCETTISPELLPPDANGEIQQSTEQTIGKYDLHDFFLYHFIRNGFSYYKIYAMAQVAFKDAGIDDKQIKETLDTFKRRFDSNQFKRNCIPDGPKVGSVALSPRGDWRMPSDFC